MVMFNSIIMLYAKLSFLSKAAKYDLKEGVPL